MNCFIKGLHGRRKRIARAHLPEYIRREKARSTVGILRFGGGLNIENWRRELDSSGFFTYLTPFGVAFNK